MIHPRCPIPQWEGLCKLTPGIPHYPGLSGAGPQPPCIPEQETQRFSAPWQCVFPGVLPALEGPSSWPPPIGSYIYEAQDL